LGARSWLNHIEEDLMPRIYSLSAMDLFLILSFLLDRISSLLIHTVIEEDQFSPAIYLHWIVGHTVANLFFLLALLGLGWLILLKLDKDILVAILYIILGIICMLYIPILLIGPSGVTQILTSSIFGMMTRGFRMTLMENVFGSYFGMAAAGILVFGVLGLIRRKDHLPNRQFIMSKMS
jgi:hypothetical protein